jgi:hypothetical protein
MGTGLEPRLYPLVGDFSTVVGVQTARNEAPLGRECDDPTHFQRF